jgi:FAD:protein FMN transferase
MPSTTLSHKQKANFSFEAIGTQWSIDLSAEENTLNKLSNNITAVINAYDAVYSRFRSDSMVTQMAQKAGVYALPEEGAALLTLYDAMYAATNGKVTPLIGQTISDAGYDANYSFRPQTLYTPPTWKQTLSYDAHMLTLKHPALLDFGAAGKGQLVDLVASTLDTHGIVDYCVDAGGDMRCRGKTALRVGLEDPDDPAKVIGVVDLSGQSLCGSAGNRRAWSRYHHILDPKTLASPQHLKAVWVIADSTMLADGMATCLFFADPAALQAKFPFEYVLYYTDGKAVASAGFTGTLFTMEQT